MEDDDYIMIEVTPQAAALLYAAEQIKAHVAAKGLETSGQMITALLRISDDDAQKIIGAYMEALAADAGKDFDAIEEDVLDLMFDCFMTGAMLGVAASSVRNAQSMAQQQAPEPVRPLRRRRRR